MICSSIKNKVTAYIEWNQTELYLISIAFNLISHPHWKTVAMNLCNADYPKLIMFLVT